MFKNQYRIIWQEKYKQESCVSGKKADLHLQRILHQVRVLRLRRKKHIGVRLIIRDAADKTRLCFEWLQDGITIKILQLRHVTAWRTRKAHEKCLYFVKRNRKTNRFHILGTRPQKIHERGEIWGVWMQHLLCCICERGWEKRKRKGIKTCWKWSSVCHRGETVAALHIGKEKCMLTGSEDTKRERKMWNNTKKWIKYRTCNNLTEAVWYWHAAGRMLHYTNRLLFEFEDSHGHGLGKCKSCYIPVFSKRNCYSAQQKYTFRVTKDTGYLVANMKFPVLANPSGRQTVKWQLMLSARLTRVTFRCTTERRI